MKIVLGLGVMLLLAAAAGCSAAGPGTTTSSAPTAAQPTPSFVPSFVPTFAAQPPTGMLTSPTGTSREGMLGTHCWQGLCGDMFETPAAESLNQSRRDRSNVAIGRPLTPDPLSPVPCRPMLISSVEPILLRGQETYRATSGTAEATDNGDWQLLVKVTTDEGLVGWSDVETLASAAMA